MEVPRWEYRVVQGTRHEVDLAQWLNQFGVGGWEVASTFAAVSNGSTRGALTIILKRPMDMPADLRYEPKMAAKWMRDPSRRHEMRYYDGEAWTDHVSDRGERGLDPMPDEDAT